jgi:cyclic pyranopterin phosphate synthase
MFKFCKNNNIVLQLIELIESESCDDDKFSEDYHYNLDSIENELSDIADDVHERKFMQGRKKYYINGGEIEVVRPVDNSKFCAKCSRLRITPDGKIKPCLLRNDNLVELISHVRNNESDEELEKIFINGINKREPFNN